MEEEPVNVPLDVQMYAAMEKIPEQVLIDAKLEIVPDILGGLTVMMRKKIYTHQLATWVEQTSVPTNWWQHLRMQLGLSYKDRMSVAKITRYRTYPDLPVLPQRHVGISYLQEERSTWT